MESNLINPMTIFQDPIKDYRLPIKHLNNWFESIIVTKKREDIALLIKDLISTHNHDAPPLPEIQLPTLNGKLLELPDFTEEHADFEEGEEAEAFQREEVCFHLFSIDLPHSTIKKPI